MVNLKYPTIRSIDDKKAVRMYRLGENYTPLSKEMKEEVRKLQRYSNQVRLVCKEKLKTLDDVKVFISKTNDEMNDYIDSRQKYRNKLRNCKDEELIKEYKNKINDCSLIIKKYRYDLKVANQMIKDVPRIKDVIKIERNMKNKEFEVQKNKKKNMER